MQIGYDGRKRVRAAHDVLAELGTYIPDTEPGWLRYGDRQTDEQWWTMFTADFGAKRLRAFKTSLRRNSNSEP